MRKAFLLFAVLVAITGVAYSGAYDVVNRYSDITLDGAVDEDVWKNVPTINGGFRFPWEMAEAPDTVFRAFHDGKNFYFSFVCEDPAVLAKEVFDGERTVDNEDRVELFFAPAPVDVVDNYAVPLYYAVEVDPRGRVHDYSITYYRLNLDSSWNMPGFKTAGKILPNGYSVEGVIPLASLENLGLLKDNHMLTGVFRAEFSGDVEAPDTIVQRWISWIDPLTAVPDFHVAEAFGFFRFLK